MLGAGNQYRTRDCAVLAVFLADLQASARIQRIHQLEQEAFLAATSGNSADAATTAVRHPNYLAMMPVTTAFFLGEGHAATLLKQVATDVLSKNQPMPEIEPVQVWAYKNAALAVQSYVLAATSHDLQTSIMEGYDGRRLREILRIPDRYGIPMVVATGIEYADEQQSSGTTVRLPLDEIVFQDTFGAPPLMLRLEEVEEDDDDTGAGNERAGGA